MFGDTCSKAINKLAHEKRAAARADHHEHPRFWHDALSQKWDELSTEERKMYEDLALIGKDSTASLDEDQIY